MKKWGVILSAFALIAFGQVHAGECNGSPPPKPKFTLQDMRADLDAKADALNAWWVEGRAEMPLAEGIVERQRRIEEVYETLAAQRKAVYSTAVCTFTSTKKCASTPGKKHFCPMSEEAPSKTSEFVIAQMKPIDDDFSIPPNGDARSIFYEVKKTGSGSNTAGFSAPVRYTASAIDYFTEQDVSLAREYFQSRVALSAPDLQVQTSGSLSKLPGDGCSGLEGALAKLKGLRDSGALTEVQYQAAVNAKIKACS